MQAWSRRRTVFVKRLMMASGTASAPAAVPVPTDPCSLEDEDDPTNVLLVTGQVNGLALA